jgi:Mrp family chromosome partitioning ATPase
MRRHARQRTEGPERFSLENLAALDEYTSQTELRLLADIRAAGVNGISSGNEVQASLERLRSLRRESLSAPGKSLAPSVLERLALARDFLHRSVPGLGAGVRFPEEWLLPELAHLYATLEQAPGGLGSDRERAGFLVDDAVTVLGITSAIAGEGKTTLALNLALSAAQSTFKRVCLIDLTLREGDLGKRLGIDPAAPGVIDRLESHSQALARVPVDGCEELVIVPSGRAPINPSRMARSLRVGELFEITREMFDLVLVDLPSVTEDFALPLIRHLDGVVMVISAGVTPRQEINRAMDQVGREKILGTFLNHIPEPLTLSRPWWGGKRA